MGRVYRNRVEHQRKIVTRLAKIDRSVKAEFKRQVKLSLQDARGDMTMGGLTPKILRLFDSPYARRHGRVLSVAQPRWKINYQTGKLNRSFYTEKTEGPKTLSFRLLNRSKHSIVLRHKGTKHMLDRGFREEIAKRFRKRANPALAEAMRRAGRS